MHVKGTKGKNRENLFKKRIADVFIKTSAILYRNLYESYNDLYRFSVELLSFLIL